MENFSVKARVFFERIINFFMLRLFKKELEAEIMDQLFQFVEFGIVGISNTLLGYIIYAVALKIMRNVKLWPKIDFLMAEFIMFIITVAWSFYWNNKVVFKEQEGEKRNIFVALIKTYISYAFTSLFLAEALLILWVKIFGINEFLAPVISLLVTVPLNFIIQKLWAFKK